jgi:hypothetical protein
MHLSRREKQRGTYEIKKTEQEKEQSIDHSASI